MSKHFAAFQKVQRAQQRRRRLLEKREKKKLLRELRREEKQRGTVPDPTEGMKEAAE